MTHDHSLDATGLLCPLPVLKAAKRMRALADGEVLRLLADDPAAIVDVPHYCTESGNGYLGMEDAGGGVQAHFIKKSDPDVPNAR
jgi:tRNA 2-thiouridine synthesizing protein A